LSIEGTTETAGRRGDSPTTGLGRRQPVRADRCLTKLTVIGRGGNNRKFLGEVHASTPLEWAVDEVVRKRFHDVENYVHRLEARCLVLEQDVEVIAKDVEHAATMQQMNSLIQLTDLKFQMLQNELAPLKRAVYGLITIIVVAVVGAIVSGVLK
jgi:hypothetical protein